MSPVLKPQKERIRITSRTLLWSLSAFCALLMLISVGTSFFDFPVNTVTGSVFVPFQKGIGSVGRFMGDRVKQLGDIKGIIEENNELKKKVQELTEENTLLMKDKYELNQLRELVSLDTQYDSYNKIGARVIGSDGGNWYSTFIIDKGTKDGIDVDMNVLADGGLVGIVTGVGHNWARVSSIISDDCNVSAMTLSTGDNMIVSGSLELIKDGEISFLRLIDEKDVVKAGDKIVTSNISDKYLPNILIGYISEINKDSNNLTKSGKLNPVCDFSHLSQVLVITDKKKGAD
ncbi:MAG: rod shape-determining protein MreC [Lachnospiraceae bacterium]|nr:rod shape-determining protein MreC [Lachnospiraceae bacterium]